ncbi:MAG TPA: aminodeoxychorismate synthase component I, partial [Jiangellales bacterium]|nr:aminodeoxychorismate synthase component I [Jiangellales bacterium]
MTRALRTLLVDNYDSYTYNLFHLLAMINGVEPIVVTNDEASADELLSLDIDNIVISPGPGRPENPADFHVCLDLLRRADLPILGVCLGHQGIAVAAGGATTPAAVVMHGRLSPVRHDGPLFTGIPQEFSVVRYHSLRVTEPLPRGLKATAWADDGTVMGLDAVDRPVFGVQFHPESILTEYGDRIITNFRDLSIDWWRRRSVPRDSLRRPRELRRAMVSPGSGHAATTLHQSASRTTMFWEQIEGPLDAEVVFDELRHRYPSVWLDSAAEGVDTGRYSYIALAEGVLAETVLLDVSTRELVVVDRDGNKTNHPGANLFDYLGGQLHARACVDAPTVPFAFVGGYVGWIGYEARAEIGTRSRHTSPTPDAGMIFADRVLAFDHRTGSVYACAISPAGDDLAGRRWLADITTTLAGLRGQRVTPPVPFATGPARAVPDRSREQYLADIARCRRLLADGETYEVCLTNQFRVLVTESGFDIYRRLRRSNPAPYGAFISLDETDVCSSSPECFMRVDRDGTVRVKPIKGTIRRGSDAGADERHRAQLATSEKERAENLMIVDLLRNDLGRICATGSVRVPSLMAVESFQTVHQLVSTITGTLRPDRSVGDRLRAVFPGGSMTGAPKIRTMNIIDELETSARGVYSGTIGYLGVDGAADLSIVIRTVVCQDGMASVGAGGAVTILSDAEAEPADRAGVDAAG